MHHSSNSFRIIMVVGQSKQKTASTTVKLIFFVNFCILTDSLPRIDYIVLEDLTSGLEGPCVCDLKIGARGIIFFYLFIFNTDQLLHFRI